MCDKATVILLFMLALYIGVVGVVNLAVEEMDKFFGAMALGCAIYGLVVCLLIFLNLKKDSMNCN